MGGNVVGEETKGVPPIVPINWGAGWQPPILPLPRRVFLTEIEVLTNVEEKKLPADEIEALRAILFAELRRRPGDTASLTRRAEALARIMATAKRLSPRKRIELEENLKIVLQNVERMMKEESDNE